MLLLLLPGQKVVSCAKGDPRSKVYKVLISATERAKVRKAMETMLLKIVMKIVSTVNREKDHIPPITTSETNPFPYQITLNPKGDGWGARMGIF
jgi:hypothetical protein